jgi:Tol biopolymer transport system component
MNADGGNVRQLTSGRADDVLPTWSPDDGQILFARSEGNDAGNYVINADGTALRELEGVTGASPAWAADGTIVLSERAGGITDIQVIDADGRGRRLVTASDDSELARRVAGGVSAPGSHGSGRDSLPSPGSCRLGHQKSAIHAQWAKRRGCWRVRRCQQARAFLVGLSR